MDIHQSVVRGLRSGKRFSAKTQRWLGCTLEQLRTYLERQFLPGMTWENRGPDGWHVMHKKALADFNFRADPDGEATKAYHYTNLEPVWSQTRVKNS